MKKAVCYVRSSKDRAEMSLDAQKAALQSLASKHGLDLVGSYEDAVYSGTTDDRPGFQALIAEIHNRHRSFDCILIYDTSRIARDRMIAHGFKRECEKRGVRILYATLPADMDPMTAVVLHAVYEAFDQVHSMMSRQKGVAGMRQNVLRGWRAGGRAPFGYRLVHEATGTMRDGKPVLKSKLEHGAEADLVQRYLKARAGGRPRSVAARELVIPLKMTSLVHLEWNALLYAGHTVWNVHSDKSQRGTGQRRRRDREQWVIQRDTHPALITELEAEMLIARLEASNIGLAIRAARAADSDHLLAGLVETSDGQIWVGEGRHYRLKACNGRRGRYLTREALDQAVIQQVRAAAANPEYLAGLCDVWRRQRPPAAARPEHERQIAKLEREAERAAALAVKSEEPEPFIALVERKRAEARAVRRQADLQAESARVRVGPAVTPEQIHLLLQANLKAAVRAMVARVELNADCRFRLHYVVHRPAMASPRPSVGQTEMAVSEWLSVAA